MAYTGRRMFSTKLARLKLVLIKEDTLILNCTKMFLPTPSMGAVLRRGTISSPAKMPSNRNSGSKSRASRHRRAKSINRNRGHQHTAALHKGSISVFLFFRKKENGAVFAVKVEGVGAVSGLRRGTYSLSGASNTAAPSKHSYSMYSSGSSKPGFSWSTLVDTVKGQRLHRVAAVLKVNGDGHRTFRLEVVKDLVQQIGIVAYHNAAPSCFWRK